MSARPLFAAALLFAVGSQASLACLWDRDTFREEGARHSELLDVISGRFPRNPPAFYEARLARVTQEIASHPDQLDLYDDAGVACDRLHRPLEAIAWMGQKASALVRNPDKEHQYRYHANLGTFLIHQWLGAGADPSKPGGRQGAEHLRKALAINPDAHFGREIVQIDAIEWLLEERANGTVEPVDEPRTTNLFRSLQWYRSFPPGTNREDALRGLAGLVVLGSAWESVDLFDAISRGLSANRSASLARLASLRVAELLADGHASLADGFPDPYLVSRHGLEFTAHIDKWFKQARAEADAWQSARSSFIENQIRAGKHPDTHADFWQGFDADQHPLPRLPNVAATSQGRVAQWFWPVIGSTFFSILAIVVLRKLTGQNRSTRSQSHA